MITVIREVDSPKGLTIELRASLIEYMDSFSEIEAVTDDELGRGTGDTDAFPVRYLPPLVPRGVLPS